VQISQYFLLQNRRCFLAYPKITVVPKTIQDAAIILIEHDFADRSRASNQRLRELIRTNNIRSIYLTDKKLYDPYYLRLRKWGIKSIVLHDHKPGERQKVPPHKKLIKTLIHAIGLMSCDHYIGVSKFVCNRFLSNGCVPRRKCSYVRNGIVPIQIEDQFNYYAHEQFGISKQALLIISTGRATYYKGIDFYIECAAKLIHKRHEDLLYFIHCGDGPDLPAFKELVSNRKLDGKFIFAGRRSDISQLLQSCNIGIQTSLGEAFSLSILEYMSAGLATLAPDNCGNSEAINDGENGILYSPGDIELVVRSIVKLVHNKTFRKKLGDAGKNTIRDKFHINRTNRELINILSGKL